MWGSSDPSCEVGEGQREVVVGGAAAWAEGEQDGDCQPQGVAAFMGSEPQEEPLLLWATASSPLSTRAASVPHSPSGPLRLLFCLSQEEGFL